MQEGFDETRLSRAGELHNSTLTYLLRRCELGCCLQGRWHCSR